MKLAGLRHTQLKKGRADDAVCLLGGGGCLHPITKIIPTH